ncbi:MAG TPA: inositol monophosphatase family protein [Balneolaceae bacterium]|nr:inositol monophosphatase family protein [Balneolaceae bacterium]
MTDLEVARLAARKGRDTILEYRKKGIKVSQKGEHDLVTDADVAAEKAILSVLKEHFPNDEALAEESAAHDSMSGARTWIIDPIDGTTNFANDFPIYCVSVALWEEKQPKVGVVLEVSREEEFYAEKGGGAWLNGEKIQVSDVDNPQRSFIATGFPYDNLSLIDEYLVLLKTLMRDVQGIRRPGSAAYDLCCVACGRFDGFFEYSLHIWDMAAAALIITEAGGVITDWNGGDGWPFGQRAVAGNREIHNFLLAQIKEHVSEESRKNVL